MDKGCLEPFLQSVFTVFSFACCHCVSARVFMGTLFQQCPSEAPHTAFFSVVQGYTAERGTVTFPCDVGQGKSWDCSLPAPTSASSHVHSVHLTLLSEVIALCLSAWGRELDRPWDQGFPGSAFTRPGLGETPGSKEPAHHVRPPRGPSRVEGNCPSVVQSLRLTPQPPHPLRPAICGDTCRCGPSRRSTA